MPTPAGIGGVRHKTLLIAALASGCASWFSPYQPTPTSDTFDPQMRGGGLGAPQLDRLVQDRAPVDLDCAPSSLTVKDLGGRTVAVLGCDARAVYIYLVEPGEWTLDSIHRS